VSNTISPTIAGLSQPDPRQGSVERAVARDAVRPLPNPNPTQDERRQRLLQLRVRADDPAVALAAIEAAASLRCMLPFTCWSTDIGATAEIGRYLVWSAFNGVVDARRAFRRANVDRYLIGSGTGTERGLRDRRRILYGTGRVLHPREYPPARVVPSPRAKRQIAASTTEIQELKALIPGLPPQLGSRVQVLFDLCYGAGARPADFKTLRGNAISTVRMYERGFSVVTLPNLSGGVRAVPVTDPEISARLLDLAARAGDGLVLAPNAEFAERNIVNRVSEHLRRHGYPGINTAALRNRWALDLSERVPAALLVQLADVLDLRLLSDQREQLHRYKTRHAITLMMEGTR
jgi:hypothetical protein